MAYRDLPAWLRIGLPNALSALRLLLVPVFPFVGREWRLAIVAAAGLTDWLDGFLARRGGATTFGRLLDATADKAVAVVVLLTLTFEGAIQWWQLGLLILREPAVAVSLACVWWRSGREGLEKIEHRLPGKVATAASFAFLVSLLAFPEADAFNRVLFWIAAAAVAFAAGHNLLVLTPRRCRGDFGRDEGAGEDADADADPGSDSDSGAT